MWSLECEERSFGKFNYFQFVKKLKFFEKILDKITTMIKIYNNVVKQKKQQKTWVRAQVFCLQIQEFVIIFMK